MDYNLECHRKVNFGVTPYICSLCPKAFQSHINLKHHMRTHTGKKPYECKLCQKAFTQKVGLISHERAHTGEKPYKCSLCPKAFQAQSSLKHHIRTHTGEKPYECKLCQKAFTQKVGLINHERTHTGEKPYKCSLCNKAFGQKCSLVYHTRTHARVKPCEGKRVVPRMKGKQHGNELDQSLNKLTEGDNYTDGKMLSTTKTRRDFSFVQIVQPGPVDVQLSTDQSAVNRGMNPFILRHYGCVMCDEMFEFETEFIEHCFLHYSDAPQKDTFIDLFEIPEHLLKYYTCVEETD